jgi:hypothetical protein
MHRKHPFPPGGLVAGTLSVCLILGVVLAACQGGAATTRQVTLRTLNDSGVSGTATLTDLGNSRTRVQIAVSPAGNPDMPAHIHPGTCENLTPQPRFPLENVSDGRSVTEVPASLEELTRGDVAINVHHSNDDMATYTACGEIR